MLEPQIITETRQWLAINKPAGLNVERLWDYPSLEHWVYEYLQKTTGRADPYLGVVHRLDRPTSGVVLMARNKSTLRALNAQFTARAVRKTYCAQVAAELSLGARGVLVHYLRKDQQRKRSFAYAQPKANRKRAVLQYECVGVGEGYSELRVQPTTGRHHQIRVQLAAQGWTILGDVQYGGPLAQLEGRIMLHASLLEFVDPQTNNPTVVSAAPPTLENWLNCR